MLVRWAWMDASYLGSFLHITPPGANCWAAISGSLLQFHRFWFAAELDGHTAARFTTDADMVITLLHLTGIRQFATFLRRSALQYYRYFGQRSSQIIMT